MTEPEVVDAVIVDPPEPAPEPLVTTALAPRARVTHEVLRPLDVQEQAAAMQAYQQGLQSILHESDWQNAGRGEKFVKKSGWRKIAAWFNLSIELVRDEVERDDDGQPVRATVWARAVAPNGRYADGDGHCAVDERRFERNKGKLENDLRGTAATRATNRAISNLVGMGAVSAEEIDTHTPAPPTKEFATREQTIAATNAILTLCNGEKDTARVRWEQIKQTLGLDLPKDAALALLIVAGEDIPT